LTLRHGLDGCNGERSRSVKTPSFNSILFSQKILLTLQGKSWKKEKN